MNISYPLLCSLVHCSSCSHTCDAFQLAHASFRLYCVQNNNTPASNSQKVGGKPGPRLLGDPPKFDISLPEADDQGEEGSSGALPAIKIYDDDVTMRFLVCGLTGTLVCFDLHNSEYLFTCCLVEYIMVAFTGYNLHSLQDACALGSLEDGLNALLNIEVSSLLAFVFISRVPQFLVSKHLLGLDY
jgi:hypothetical protein